MYVDLLPPCNSACPAGEDIQTYLAHVKAGEHERAWRVLVEDNPFAAIHGRVCYHPCETDCNRANLDSAVSIHAVERFLGDLALEREWRFDPPAGAQRQAGAGDRRRAERALGRLPPGAARPRGRDPRRRPGAGRDDALRHPRLPDAARRAERRDRADRGAGRADDRRPPRRGSRGRAPRGRVRRGVRRGRRAPVQAGGHPRPGRGPDRRRRVVPAQRGIGRAAGDRASGRGLRRRQHGDGRGEGGAAAGRGGGADRLPPHARADAGARGGGRGRRAGGRADQLAADDQGVRGPAAAGRGDGARRVRLPAADRAVRDARRGHRDPRAGPGDRHRLPARRARGGVRARRHRPGLGLADDRMPRACSPAATWCPPSARSRSAWGTASGPRGRSTRGCAARRSSARRSIRRRRSTC